MNLPSFLSRMGRSDARLIGRDQFLVGLAVYPVIFWAVLRFAVPVLADWLMATYSFDLQPAYPLLTSIMVYAVSAFIGMIGGMLLVEERDEGTLTAVMVTPVSLDAYVLYRCSTAAVIGFGLTMLILPNLGLSQLSFTALLSLSLLGSLSAPLNALLFFSLARNKIQAFGVLKALGAIGTLPFAAWFVPRPWRNLIGLFPPYWPVEGVWRAAAGEPYAWVFMPGLITFGLSFIVLVRLFRQKAYDGADS